MSQHPPSDASASTDARAHDAGAADEADVERGAEAVAPPNAGELASCLHVLERIAGDRALLAALDTSTRRRLLVAAGRVSRPERHEQRHLSKALRRRDRDERKATDQRLLDATGLRELRRAAVFATPPPRLPAPAPESEAPRVEPGPELVEPRKCYVCKAEFRRVHFFYDQMCPACAELNYEKRSQTADLTGRTALVTGARVKIGFQAAIMLLRAGARVVVTTRFPVDAARRYGAEADFDAWRDRLAIYGLDLRHTPSVERFAAHLAEVEPTLDLMLHNAAQTVRRPPGFYAHLMAGEEGGEGTVPEHVRGLLGGHRDLVLRRDQRRDVGLVAAPQLSQLPLLDSDRDIARELFPQGRLDADLQQVDMRGVNSWRLTLAEVPTVELLEVHLVNAVAPFVLAARLKRSMMRRPGRDKHIVNVSAVEGQFYRSFKTDRHPHTNMAKAALNMLTRTSAADYVRDGIHMNSVDTGWVTDEDPVAIAARKTEEHGFHPPLDVVDGAARICDPIFTGYRTGVHPWGQFFKDYAPADW